MRKCTWQCQSDMMNGQIKWCTIILVVQNNTATTKQSIRYPILLVLQNNQLFAYSRWYFVKMCGALCEIIFSHRRNTIRNSFPQPKLRLSRHVFNQIRSFHSDKVKDIFWPLLLREKGGSSQEGTPFPVSYYPSDTSSYKEMCMLHLQGSWSWQQNMLSKQWCWY